MDVPARYYRVVVFMGRNVHAPNWLVRLAKMLYPLVVLSLCIVSCAPSEPQSAPPTPVPHYRLEMPENTRYAVCSNDTRQDVVEAHVRRCDHADGSSTRGVIMRDGSRAVYEIVMPDRRVLATPSPTPGRLAVSRVP